MLALVSLVSHTSAQSLVIGHRGASGYRPEHTLASYQLAIDLGADYIEPDLVSTRDGVLVARHEPMLGGTTNIAAHPEFANRRTTKVVDGVSVTDWFASDFTLAEIRTLRAIQPNAGRDQSFNGLYQIPTFAEVVALAKAAGVGVYPETKHPTFHDSLGLSLEEPMLAVLSLAGWNHATAPVFIQSFEVSNLQELNRITDVKLVQLIDANDVNPDGSMDLSAPFGQPYDFVVKKDPRTFADLLTPVGLAFVASYADGIGPWKPYLLRTRIFDPNHDGVFSDFPDTALAAQAFERLAAAVAPAITGRGADGIRRSLEQKVGNAKRQADRGSIGAATALLRAFIDELQRQSTSRITNGDRQRLVAAADRILSSL